MFSYVLARENSRKILEHNFQTVLRGNFGSLGGMGAIERAIRAKFKSCKAWPNGAAQFNSSPLGNAFNKK
jgi:hypothetical protein